MAAALNGGCLTGAKANLNKAGETCVAKLNPKLNADS